MENYSLLFNSMWISIYAFVLVLFFLGIIFLIASLKRKKSEKIHEYDLTFLHIKLPKDNEYEVGAAEHLFTNLIGIKKPFFKRLFTGDYRVSFEIVSKTSGIGFYIVVPDEIASFVEKQVNGAYPDAEIDIVNPKEVWDRGKYTKVTELKLRGPLYSPLRIFERIIPEGPTKLRLTPINVTFFG